MIEQQDHQKAQEHIRRRLEGEVDSVHYTAKGKRADRQPLWVEIHGTHIMLNGEDVIAGTVLDITQRYLDQMSLRESENKFRAVFEQSASGMCLTSLDGILIQVNQPLCDMLGYTRAELEGIHFNTLTHPEDLEIGKSFVKRILNGEIMSGSFEKRYLTKSGGTLWANINSALIRDAGNKPIHFITQIENITEKKQIVSELQHSEERFSKAFSAGPIGITITRISDGTFLEANQYFLDLFGFSKEEVIGKTSTHLKMWSQEERQKIIDAQLSSGGLLSTELTARSRSGAAIHLLFSSRPIELENQSCLITVLIDISEKKNAEMRLVESEYRFRSLFENMNAGFVLFEVVQDADDHPVDLKIVAANSGFESTTGLRLKDAEGKYLTQVLPGIEKDEADWIGTYAKVALTGESIHFEQTSTLLNTHYSISAFQSGPKLCAVTFTDVTARKKAELALMDSEERLRLSTELARVAVWEYDFTTDTCRVRAIMIFSTDLIGRKCGISRLFLNATHPEDRDDSTRIIQNAVAPGGTDDYSFDFRVVHPDRSHRWLMVNGRVIQRDSLGRGIIVRGTLMDITARKRAEEEIRKLNESLELKVALRTAELEQANQELEAFTYSVSHDLRAPLRAIDGFSRFLKEDFEPVLNEEGVRLISVIRNNVSRMDQLISDLLQLSKVSKNQLNFSQVDMQELVEEILSDTLTDSQRNSFKIEVEPMPTVRCDRSLLRQVWINLISNAVKYSGSAPEKWIRIRSRPEGAQHLFVIEDHGVGFNPRYKDKLFGIFQRLHNMEEFEGTESVWPSCSVSSSVTGVAYGLWAKSKRVPLFLSVYHR